MATPTATLERLQELRELLAFSYDLIFSNLSVREIVAVSYDAGGMFPTFFGYAIGAIGTFCFSISQRLATRLLSALLALLFFVHCVQRTDDIASVLLLSIAALVGVGCTAVQAMSLRLVFAHLDARRQDRITKRQRRTKRLKDD